MIGRSISHYNVISALGSGGMGVVYLAEDERLGRQVALKFLPADSVTSRQALDRFRIEARAASSLSHPGICAIFDIGDDQGTPYIVMEALKGECLRDRIDRGPMKVADLLEIAIQLADALDAAHAQGIIHRDIKPSNIFVGDKNRTKILDFGLAKLTAATLGGAAARAPDASTHRDLTMPGSALGTVSYMSPEQARGEEVDTRTDLFSLGVVLYEMATGIQAFTGSTQAVVFEAILNRTPQPVSHVNPLIPPRLEALIGTALEKDRDLRHQHASDVEAELKRIRRDLESGSLVAATSRAAVIPAKGKSATIPAAEPALSRGWIGAAVAALAILAILGFKLWSDTVSQETATNTTSTATPGAEVPVPVTTPVPDQSGAPPIPPPTTPAVSPPVPRSQDGTSAARPAPQPQLQQPARPTAERPQATPPPVTPAPQRAADGPNPVTIAVPASPPNAALPPTPQATESPSPSTSATPSPAQPVPSPPPADARATQPPASQPPPRNAASTTPAQPAIPPVSPVESDDALIRGVIRTYERAIETKNVDLFRSVRPGLSAAEEGRLRASFSQIDSQQVDITVEELRVEGRTATVRLARRDTFMSGGRRQTNASRQTLRFEKAAAGWIITEIIGK